MKNIVNKFRVAAEEGGLSETTRRLYERYIFRFIEECCGGKGSPLRVPDQEIMGFLDGMSGSSKRQAISALNFLYRRVLYVDREVISGVEVGRPKPIARNLSEIEKVFIHMDGAPWLIARIVHETGATLSDVIVLRVGQIDIESCKINVGYESQPLSGSLSRSLALYLGYVRMLHDKDLSDGFGLAPGFDDMSVSRRRRLENQYAFPSEARSVGADGQQYRQALDIQIVQRSLRRASSLAGLEKQVTFHDLKAVRPRRQA